MAEYGTMEKGVAGLLYGLNRDVFSRSAVGEVEFGKAVMAPLGASDTGSSAKSETAKVVFSADLVTGNKINIVVNGTVIPEVVFATSHLATMNLIIDAIVNQGYEATLNSNVANNRELLVRTNGAVAVVTVVITEGGSQATTTITGITTAVFVGVSIFSQKEKGLYEASESISVLEEGMIYVQATGGVEANAKAFLDVATGNFASSGDLEVGRFKTNGTDELVVLSVDGLIESALAEQF